MCLLLSQEQPHCPNHPHPKVTKELLPKASSRLVMLISTKLKQVNIRCHPTKFHRKLFNRKLAILRIYWLLEEGRPVQPFQHCWLNAVTTSCWWKNPITPGFI